MRTFNEFLAASSPSGLGKRLAAATSAAGSPPAEFASGIGGEIPSVVRTGRVTHLRRNENPIYMRLDDGTECHFTRGQYDRIRPEPFIGAPAAVEFQRAPGDRSGQHSQIKSVRIDSSRSKP